MSLSRRIAENRPTVILIILVVLSMASLATGTHAVFLRKMVRSAVTVTAKPFLVSIKTVQNKTVQFVQLITAYDSAKAEVEALHLQVGAMMKHMVDRQVLESENKRLRRMLNFVRNEPRLVLEPAKVIGRSKGILLIDRGSLHGMQVSLCAMTERGFLGFIREVDPLTSNVVLLESIECKVGAMIKRNHVRGMVHGRGSDLGSPICTMEYIDIKDEVHENDEVVTSPESKFPAGYSIGVIVAVHSTGSLWKSADVRPSVDMDRVDELFILRNSTPSVEEITGVSEPAVLPESDALNDADKKAEADPKNKRKAAARRVENIPPPQSLQEMNAP